MSDNDLRTLMRDAVGDAPAREFSTPVIASAARARTRRRRAWYGVAGIGAAASVAAAVAVGGGLLGGPAPAPVAQPTAAASSPAPDPGAIGLPTSLPVGETVAVVDAELPAGTTVGELAMDAAWTPAGTIELPLATSSGAAKLSIAVTASGCSADSAALGGASLDAIASAVCAAASQYPNPPGTVVDGGSIDPAA
jgi:hypothetical protein